MSTSAHTHKDHKELHQTHFRLFSGTYMQRMAQEYPNMDVLREVLLPQQELFKNFLTFSYGYLQCHDYVHALSCFDHALQIDPFHHKVLFNRALCYIQLNRIDKALKDGKYLIQLYPTWPYTYILSSACYFLSNKFNESISMMDNAEAFDHPENRYSEEIQRLRKLYTLEKAKQDKQKFIKIKLKTFVKMIGFHSDTTWNKVLSEICPYGILGLKSIDSHGKEHIIDDQMSWETFRDSTDHAKNKTFKGVYGKILKVSMSNGSDKSLFFEESTTWSEIEAILSKNYATELEVYEKSQEFSVITINSKESCEKFVKENLGASFDGDLAFYGQYTKDGMPIMSPNTLAFQKVIPDFISFTNLEISLQSFERVAESMKKSINMGSVSKSFLKDSKFEKYSQDTMFSSFSNQI